MNARPYLILSGTIFAAISLLHLVRILRGWPFVVGPWSTPVGLSWAGFAAALALAVWAFRLSSRAR
jgi:hypothetical protein